MAAKKAAETITVDVSTVEGTVTTVTEVAEPKEPGKLAKAWERVKHPQTKVGKAAKGIIAGAVVFGAGVLTGKALESKGEASDAEVLQFFDLTEVSSDDTE